MYDIWQYMINSSSVTISNIYKFYFQAAKEREKQETTPAFKMWFAENVWLFQANVIISFQCILRSNISFVYYTFVYVLRGRGGLGPWQQLKNEFLEPTHCLQIVSAMIVNFIRWVVHYVRAPLIPVCRLIFQCKEGRIVWAFQINLTRIYLGRSFYIVHVWLIDGRV